MIAAIEKKKRLYVSKDFLKANGANFTLEGFRFHCRKLDEYTNPKGAGIDKLPLNTKAREQEYRNSFRTPQYVINDEGAAYRSEEKKKKVFLNTKKRHQIALHMIGKGSVCFWTGSRSRKTLLGLDIDDHESNDPQEVLENSVAALRLFEELTGWKPETCPSGRGIHGFVILDKGAFQSHQTNQYWHGVVKHVQAEAKRRGLVANLECKGKIRIVNDTMEYAGLLLKDPFTAMNPTDDQIKSFWNSLEEKQITDSQLKDALATLASDEYVHRTSQKHLPVKPSVQVNPNANEQFLEPTVSGTWISRCREWAIGGLQKQDSMTDAVYQLAKWFYFIELWEIHENQRFDKVVELLQQFCLMKHNGFITRLDLGKTEEVMSHVRRIVQSMVQRCTDSAKVCFATVRNKRNTGKYQDTWYLERLLLNTDTSLPVKLTVCSSVCTTMKKNPEEWEFKPDHTQLPKPMEEKIRKGLKAKGAKDKTYLKLVGFINHLKANGGEARLSQLALKKNGILGSHCTTTHPHAAEIGIDPDFSGFPNCTRWKQVCAEGRSQRAFGNSGS